MNNQNKAITSSSLRIITWNVNGIKQRVHELEIFLNYNHIDIALISETHLTQKDYVTVSGYKLYSTNHPSGKGRGGTAVLIKENIFHIEQEKICYDFLQSTIISIKHNNANLTIAAAYCPPRYKIEKKQLVEIFSKLGPRFIFGGDFNVKHTAWGSRLITPKKGNEFLAAITACGCNFYSSRKPTYWPTDQDRKPDLLDFFITRAIGVNYVEVTGIEDLSSDHIPVLLELSATVLRKKVRHTLTNKFTDWDLFRTKIDESIDLKIRLKTTAELEQRSQQFINLIRKAAMETTPSLKEETRAVSYPLEVKKLINKRRRARRIWHRTHNPMDKTLFNRLNNQLRRLINNIKQQSFDNYIENLSPEADRDYSLWKAARRFKRPLVQIPPMKDEQGEWVRSDESKAELFARHLASVFQPHEINSDINTSINYCTRQVIEHVTPLEVTKEISNSNRKKAPGADEITSEILKELPRKGVIMLTQIFNACLRLKHVPKCFKTSQIIMLLKPGKPAETVSSYRPISLLPTISKIFEKLLLKRLKPLVNLPDHQFGFRNKHSTIEQIQRVTNKIETALEEKKFCSAVFLDISQAFDRVWHEGLIHKMSNNLPKNMCQLLESYLSERTFRVSHGESKSKYYPIHAGVPQGSVLGPILYLMYTADIPTTAETSIATFADDTAILSISDSLINANVKLQHTINKISKWTRDWKIMLNHQKSVHVIYTLRHYNYHPVYLERLPIPQKDSAKYLGMHLDARLNWKTHVKMKKEQITLKWRQMYWLIGRNSKLSLRNKRLLYMQIIRPIWTYGIQLWGCAKKSNRLVIQRIQNKCLRSITGAQWYQRNEDIHSDLEIPVIDETIRHFANTHQQRLRLHPNEKARNLLITPNDAARRLKRTKPYELAK